MRNHCNCSSLSLSTRVFFCIFFGQSKSRVSSVRGVNPMVIDCNNCGKCVNLLLHANWIPFFFFKVRAFIFLNLSTWSLSQSSSSSRCLLRVDQKVLSEQINLALLKELPKKISSLFQKPFPVIKCWQTNNVDEEGEGEPRWRGHNFKLIGDYWVI